MNTVIGADGGAFVSPGQGLACAAFVAVCAVAGLYLLRRALRLQRREPPSKHAARYSHPHR